MYTYVYAKQKSETYPYKPIYVYQTTTIYKIRKKEESEPGDIESGLGRADPRFMTGFNIVYLSIYLSIYLSNQSISSCNKFLFTYLHIHQCI